MALRQTKKISELPALSPATLDTTFIVGISGSTTYKISINQLTSSLDTTFATDLVTTALSNSLDTKLSTSSYSTDSASFNSRIISGSAVAGTISGSSQISALGFVTGSYTTINSFNSLTQSFNSISQSFTTVSGSFGSIDFSGINNVTTSYLAFTQSYYSASASFDSRITTVSASVSIGTSGTSGINGTSGTNGTSGAQGNQGPTGPQGNQGPQGESGTSGTTGTSGTNGVQGPQGTQGVEGPQGINGTAGSSGAQGSQGPTGPQGNQGATGSGTQGAQGPTGGTGPQGTQGNQGPQGVQGSIGTSGTSGVSMDSGSFATTGSNSFNGNQNITGSLIVSSVAVVNGGINVPTGSIISLTSGSSLFVDVSGSITSLGGITGSIAATNGVVSGSSQLISSFPSKTTGNWTVPAGASTQSFSVESGASYTMWVNGNIPNGIITWNATVTTSNTNVPVVGFQYGWYYTAGNALVLTSMPDQIVGTNGSIVTSPASYAPNTSNVFKFGITNNSGTSQTINYGYIKLS